MDVWTENLEEKAQLEGVAGIRVCQSPCLCGKCGWCTYGRNKWNPHEDGRCHCP